jgi:hypothetical protein
VVVSTSSHDWVSVDVQFALANRKLHFVRLYPVDRKVHASQPQSR